MNNHNTKNWSFICFFNLTKEMNVSVSKRETEKSRKH